MAEIINLRRQRKAKARAEEDRVAAANRAKFGRSKADRTRTTEDALRAERHLDGHRLPQPTSEPGQE
ncbi:MAG: DUF4169 family protein [Alphaproteobacteria bacterium]|nr:MAG: DUF4169 family protein [Alphaproteobacteria bacterium]